MLAGANIHHIKTLFTIWDLKPSEFLFSLFVFIHVWEACTTNPSNEHSMIHTNSAHQSKVYLKNQIRILTRLLSEDIPTYFNLRIDIVFQ